MILPGISGSRGYAAGKIYLYVQEEMQIPCQALSPQAVPEALQSLQSALTETVKQLQDIRGKTAQKAGEEQARIFDAHILLAQDPAFSDDITTLIQNEYKPAAAAVRQVTDSYVELFQNMDDPYMRERSADIADIGDRLLRNLLGLTPRGLEHLTEEVIVVAHDLSPSDTASLDASIVKGFITAVGGPTSHAAIIARTLEIPAVLGLGEIDLLHPGDTVIVDGVEGRVVAHPSDKQLRQYTNLASEFSRLRQKLKEQADLPAVTLDGKQVELAANIGKADDIIPALSYGAEGVGLFRTEFLYMDQDDLPDEETQFQAYKSAAEKLNTRPLIIRTMDAGGDKETKCLHLAPESNPFLGFRAIRICLSRLDLFKTQLRAILRASVFGNIRIMYPMISGVAEVRQANAILEEAKAELQAAQIPFQPHIQVGIMVEIPSAALTADSIAKEVDFFSIGTNDLCQYTLAVDRMNEKISHLYQPLHPAVLRLIKHTIDASHTQGKYTGMCGELAGDPLAAVILLGLGLDEFSMSAASIPVIKNIIRSVTLTQAQELAQTVLSMETPDEISEYARSFLKLHQIDY